MRGAQDARRGLRVALVQLRCEKGAIGQNLAEIARHVREAHARGCAMVCFPEMSITGYIDPPRRPDAILDVTGPEVAEFVSVTAGTGMTALAGIVERNAGGKPFITQVVAQDGRLVGWYRKRTIIDEEVEWFAAGGGELPVFRHGRVPFGIAICADIESPAVFGALARRGVSLIVEAAAPGLYGAQETRDWRAGYAWWRDECETKLGRYARESGVHIAVATQAGRTVDEDFPGGGFLFGPDGVCVAATPDWTECVLDVEIPV